MLRRIMLAAAGAATLSAGLLIGTASAAKPEPFILSVDCGDRGSFDVRLVGRDAPWTPGLIVGNGVIVPKALLNGHSTFTDNEGNVFEEFEQDIVKPGHYRDLVTCTYAFSIQNEDGTFSASGTVVGLLVGQH